MGYPFGPGAKVTVTIGTGKFELFTKDEGAFVASRLRWEEPANEPHTRVLALHRELLRLRRTDPVLAHGARARLAAHAENGTLIVDQWHGRARRRLRVRFDAAVADEPGEWSVMLRTPRAVLLGRDG
jgi:maltooligosyltrehalose trehalohydrolase